MAQRSISSKLLKKADAALIAAIEIYNKPDFLYREETFAILALNAWELLLKAKLVYENNNKLRCLYVYERRHTTKGKVSKKSFLKRNRAGNIHTIGLGRVITELENKKSILLSPAVKNNLNALIEIRDNAVHYMNATPQLAKQILEIGTASITNFLELAKKWFSYDMSNYNLYLMPIGFIAIPQATAIIQSTDEKNLVEYLSTLIRETDEEVGSNFHVALTINLSLTRSSEGISSQVMITDDQKATKIQMTDEDIRKIFPWDFKELTRRLKERYVNFKLNPDFYAIRWPLMENEHLVKIRYLDPGNPKSSKKSFYNPNIIRDFDKYYIRKE